jgi:hypothetical protein
MLLHFNARPLMLGKIVVTHVTSYDVLVGGVVLYPLGVTIDFWKKSHITIQAGKHELVTRLHC